MNLLESLLGNDSQNVVSELARQLGVGENEARSAAGQLIPALARGLQNNAQSEKGLDGLLGALAGGNHGNYLDNPSSLGQQSTVKDGNSILGHIFGSKEVSRNVANYGAQQSGLSSALLKKALPILAPLVMSALSKQFFGNKKSSGGIFGGNQNGNIFNSGVAAKQNRGMLESFLDADKDGSVIDDLLSMAVKAAIR
jgi:hypothetical protein